MEKVRIITAVLLSLIIFQAKALTVDSTAVYRKALLQIAECENRPVKYYIVADSVFEVFMFDNYGALADHPKLQEILDSVINSPEPYIEEHFSPALRPLARHKAKKIKKARIAMCYEPLKWRLVFFSEIKDGMLWANVFDVEYGKFRWGNSLYYPCLCVFSLIHQYGFIVSGRGKVKQMVWDEFYIEYPLRRGDVLLNVKRGTYK